MVASKFVYLNGQRVSHPSVKVGPGDRISIRDWTLHLPSESKLPQLFLAHKLPGEVVTRKDPEGRQTLFDRLQAMGLPESSNLKTVGRLDIRSEGLLLLTDDGELARYLEHP